MTYSVFIWLFLLQDGITAVTLANNENWTTSRTGRHKRWEEEAYDDYGGDKIDYQEETEEESRIKNLMLNWEKLALRFIFVISFLLMVTFCACHFCQKYMKQLCRNVHWWCHHCMMGWCPCCVEDPMFEKIKMFSESYGLNLSEDAYNQLKKVMEEGAAQGRGGMGMGRI
ncbi:uncharacterized protein LOC125660991 [Ostrea edulis]|uniref:uncharacterized protein LOC125660991 n=1 Tax=Ostrea edulis TaxID=37623 RepID=UPI0024AF16E1|nr:uncharacterized protein LOC125660991 [Ostrea edulis]